MLLFLYYALIACSIQEDMMKKCQTHSSNQNDCGMYNFYPPPNYDDRKVLDLPVQNDSVCNGKGDYLGVSNDNTNLGQELDDNCYIDCDHRKKHATNILTVYETKTVTDDEYNKDVDKKTSENGKLKTDECKESERSDRPEKEKTQTSCNETESPKTVTITDSVSSEIHVSHTITTTLPPTISTTQIEQSSLDETTCVAKKLSKTTLIKTKTKTETITETSTKEKKRSSTSDTKYKTIDDESKIQTSTDDICIYPELSETQNTKKRSQEVVTVTRILSETTTIEDPITLYREITTTITFDHPIINYKVTTVTDKSIITKTLDNTETLTSFIIKTITDTEKKYSTVSVTLSPSISMSVSTIYTTIYDTKTIYDKSTLVSTAFSTILESMISTVMNTSVSITQIPASDSTTKTSPKSKSSSSDEKCENTKNMLKDDKTELIEFIPLLKKLLEQKETVCEIQETTESETCKSSSDVITKKNKTTTESNKSSKEIETITVLQTETETITKYKRSKPKTITKSKKTNKKKTITVTETETESEPETSTKSPKTVYNTIYKMNKKLSKCSENDNNDAPSNTVTLFACEDESDECK
ncbi:hypothetical protein COBT_000982 [Conglomerata obtusa]